MSHEWGETTRAARRRPLGRRLFPVYAVFMVVLVAVVPLARAGWLWLAGPDGLTFVTAVTDSTWLGAGIAGLWCTALIAGRVRGPALLAPWPTHVRAASDVPRWRAFGPAVARASGAVVGLVTLGAGALAAALLAHGITTPAGAAAVIAAGAGVGAITAMCWLGGQALPRVAAVIAAAVAGVAAGGLVLPGAGALAPWGLAAGVIAGAGVDVASFLVLAAVTAGLLAGAPSLLHRLDGPVLVRQAGDASAAGAHMVMLDLEGARRRYRAAPAGPGRRLRAVRSHRALAVTFLRRDAVGAVRRPVRLLSGCAGLVIACLLVTISADLAGTGGAGWPLGAFAGLIAAVSIGAVSGGLQHAADAAETAPLYGVSDGALLALHTIFPIAAVAGVLLIATALAVALGLGISVMLAASSALLGLALLARLADVRKGPVPVRLFVPIPTEMGDLGALRRLMWAFDGLLVAAAVGIAATLGVQFPLVLVIAAVGLAGLLAMRRPRRS